MTYKVSIPLLAAALLFAGCSHEVESPSLSLTSLEPNLVCSAQRVGDVKDTAPVVINGSGFTPLPTNVLARPSILMLPTVDIVKKQDLPGETSPALSLTFSGDPAGKLAGNLSWASEEQMTLRITTTPAVTLSPGLYDVTVTNPDKKAAATMPKGLAVVPPPSIKSWDPVPPALCTAQTQREYVLTGTDFLVVAGTVPTVTLTGSAPLAAGDGGVVAGGKHDLSPSSIHADGCQDIPGKFAGGTVQLCTKLTVDLPIDQAALPPGTYDVVVTSPAPASCASSEPVKVVIVPPPFVKDVVPPAICLDQQDQVITVEGGSFARVNGTQLPKVTVAATGGTTMDFSPDSLDGCKAPGGVDVSFGVELCDTIKFTVPVNALPPGSYALTVTNPDPVGCASTDTIDLTVNAPPKVDSVAPATVCSGGSLLVATGSGFEQPNAAGVTASAELRCTDGTKIASVGVDVAADGKTAKITFGPGVSPGLNCDVVFKNPDGCEDRPLPHQVVTGTAGPILFNVDPNVAYNGINTKVLLYVTALQPPFTVKMWSGTDASKAVIIPSQLFGTKTTVIQATIPKDTAKGEYTLQVDDKSGCSASLDKAVTVTDNLTVSTGNLTPSFGEESKSVPVTIVLGKAVTSTGAPRAFLNPPGDADAIQLGSVTTVNGTTLTAVVPTGTPAAKYDLVIVWPDGQVAVLTGAYTSVSAAPPVISDVVPQSVINQAGQSIKILGTGFTGSAVSLLCNGGAQKITATAPGPTCTSGACTQTATFDASTIAQGDVCVVRVTNTDGSYGEFSAIGITNSSFNLAAPKLGKDMNVGRRALAAAAVKATSAARFLYAIGGDSGAVSGALSSVEFAPIDVFGNMNAWVNSPTSLASKRTLAGTATLGRYVYVFGGDNGTGAQKSGERALVLSPEESPAISDLDLCLAGGNQDCFAVAGLGAGLPAGVYSYRVAALIDSADPQNLGGETLAGDPIILRLRTVVGRNATVKITWTAPKDPLGADLSGITGYRVYRSPADGAPGAAEVLLAELTGKTTLTFIDDGTKKLGTAKPLPLGSTSAWRALPDLVTAREALAGAAAKDPSNPAKSYVYALLGNNGADLKTYEFLDVTTASNGRQTVGAWTTGTEQVQAGRSEIGAWVVDSIVSSNVTAPDTFVYAGYGKGTGTSGNTTDAAKVTTGGQLAAFTNNLSATTNYSGYGVAAAAGQLFEFGGAQGKASSKANSCHVVSPAPTLDNWNNEGLTMKSSRYLMGSAIQSAFIFLVGGDTGTGVTKSTETVVW